MVFFFALSCALNQWQTQITQRLLRQLSPPPVTIVNAVIWGYVAYTLRPANDIFIDGERLACCPNTFTNVMHHEIEHAKGRNHNNVTGDIMSYSVTEDINGQLLNDLYVWPFFVNG